MKACRSLRDLPEERWPEERWPEAGVSNVGDQTYLFDAALETLLPRPPRLILDLGCGLGQSARTLAQRYPEARVVGLDASPEAIAVARNAFQLPNLSFAVGGLDETLRLGNGSVNLIVATNSLAYAQNQDACAREQFRLLAPDGLMLSHSRTEESHLFYDFPHSLLLPTNTQIFLADWVRAARDSGRDTLAWSVPLGMSPTFFAAHAFPPFVEGVSAFVDQHRFAGPGPFTPALSHTLLAHGVGLHALAKGAPQSQLPPLVAMDNHLERLDSVLQGATVCPTELQRAGIAAWLANISSMRLYREAQDVLRALLPASAPILDRALGLGPWRD